MASAFVPRPAFPSLANLPRSYFLGHHRAGLTKMKTMLSSIELVIECRDYRVPLTSRNPLFEESLAGRERLIVYTKQDLGSQGRPLDRRREDIIRSWHGPSTHILFSAHKHPASIRRILDYARTHSETHNHSLTGSRMLVVGMPNVGKSSLLNALRRVGVHKGKAASTGAQPGVTRKISHSGVKIIASPISSASDGADGGGRGTVGGGGGGGGEGGVYLVDTPGVFVPYVPNSESMLKLALCGNVKDTIIDPVTMVDYLLYHLNLNDPKLYEQYHEPTNDVIVLLQAIAQKTGRLKKGGEADFEASALWTLQQWRIGKLGRFVLDEVHLGGGEQRRVEDEAWGGSMNEARRKEKANRREVSRQKRIKAE